MPKATTTKTEPEQETAEVVEVKSVGPVLTADSTEAVVNPLTGDFNWEYKVGEVNPETEAKLALLDQVTKLSAVVNWENRGTHGVDGDMYVTLGLTPKAFNAVNELVKALRGEYAKSL